MAEPMEELKGVLEFFKTAIAILHGVGSPVKMAILAVVFAFVVVWIVGTGVLEATKQVREKREGLMSMEQRLPRLFRFVYSGKVRLFLLIIVTLLFLIDWRDAT